MKRIMENWRRFNQQPSGLVLTEERLDEIFGLQRGCVALSDPENLPAPEYQEKAAQAYEYLERYQDEISAAASRQGVDPELLLGILMDEYIRMYPRGFGDLLGYFGLINASMGVAQVKGDVARKLSEEGYYTPPGYKPDMSRKELQRMIADNPEVSINYAAAFVKYVDEAWGEEVWEQVPPEEKNAILATLYSLEREPRKPGSPEWEERGAPKPSARGTQIAAAGKKISQRARHDV